MLLRSTSARKRARRSKALIANNWPRATYRERRCASLFSACRRRAPSRPAAGAPTSPALASLSAYTLDVRMAALAARIDASYSRYADDLVLSGGRRLLAH